MKVYIVIPFHNEEGTLSLTLTSIVNQTQKPDELILVNDNSTDSSLEVARGFEQQYEWISVISIDSSNEHIPGSKVINAFNRGLDSLDTNYDVICKFDADVILPENYLKEVVNQFKTNPRSGIVGGLLFIEKDDQWIYENIASKDHVRGPIKAYRKACFQAIGGLKKVIGWDTIDTLLAQYYDWEVITIKSLEVKHLKPTGKNYSKQSKLLAGERWYQMRYGFWLTLIASAKSSKNVSSFFNSVKGYFNAKKNRLEPAVTIKQGKFIRKQRWKGIRNKLIG